MIPTIRVSVVSRLLTVAFVSLFAALWVILASCGEESDPLEPDVAISGRVTNLSGDTGEIYVEISPSKRTKASPAGLYVIQVHRDFYVDSLYAYVDVGANDQYDPGEPYGFLHSSSNPTVALPIHVRDQPVPNVNIEIP
jgi:hypothetical protein